jgi:hypothetical protein
MVLVDDQEYPGDGWYEVGLLIIAAPLLAFGGTRGVRALRN